jgi:hypothetical protein
MIGNIEKLIEDYWSFLRKRLVYERVEDWVEITTPYLDRHNDYIQIFGRNREGRIVLTDGGETIQDLVQSGVQLNSGKRKRILEDILRGFGVQMENGEVTVEADEKNFALKKHSLIQAILSVNDMFFLSAPSVESLFAEDVSRWLSESDVRFTEHVKFAGRSGFDYIFDFVIPRSRAAPERIMRAINNPSKLAAQNFILSWVDTRETRPTNSIPLAMLNDASKAVPEDVVEALEAYGIESLKWTRRENYVELLAA